MLAIVVTDPGRSSAEIAERLGVTRSAVSQQLTELESAGHLSRQRSDTDRRIQTLVLEPLGEAYRDAMRSCEDELAERYERALSPADLDEVVHVLTKFRDALEPTAR